MPGHVFENAEDALKWAVEVMRRRRLPKTASFWREIETEAEWVAQAWEGMKTLDLPEGSDERMHLAMKVLDGVEEVAMRDAGLGRVLLLWVMGDWAEERRLAAALAIQEKCRREGIRVRMAYRYTYTQLAAVLGCERKAAWRKVQDGLEMLGGILARKGVVEMVEAESALPDHFKKILYSHDFKFNDE